MTPEATEIEVEVLEIDGVAPALPQVRPEDAPPPQGKWQDWRQWHGQLGKLDSRWWPLWVFLGIIALLVLFTLGLVIGVFLLVVRIFLKIVQAILR